MVIIYYWREINTVFIQKDNTIEHHIDDVTLIKLQKVLKPTGGRILACPPVLIRQSVNLPLYMFALFASDLNPFCSWLTQGKRFRITSPRRPHTGGKCCLCSAQPVRCPKISTEHEHCWRPAQQRPLRAVMQHRIPKKPWSHCGTGPVVGFLDGKRRCFPICLEIYSGESGASALLQLLEGRP